MRICDHPDCIELADYKAPKSRHSRDNYWFCLEHVKIYNREWDYYQGMSSAEIDADRNLDMTWRRETFPLGGGAKKLNPFNLVYEDPLGIISEFSPLKTKQSAPKISTDYIVFAQGSQEEEALRVLELQSPTSVDEIKNKYKQCAKVLHPDLTSQAMTDKEKQANERKLMKINSAYHVLKEYFKKLGE